MIEYVSWYSRMSVDLWQPVEVLLDPPAACFTPERKDQLSKYNKYGLLFRCYDLVRERSPPLPLPENRRRKVFPLIFLLVHVILFCQVILSSTYQLFFRPLLSGLRCTSLSAHSPSSPLPLLFLPVPSSFPPPESSEQSAFEEDVFPALVSGSSYSFWYLYLYL